MFLIVTVLILQTFSQASSEFNKYYFQYLHKPSFQCQSQTNSTLKFLIIVKSSTLNFERRTRIRQTWIPEENLGTFEVKMLFLLGIPRNSGIQERINIESKKFEDILQANFTDSYRNLTIKTIMFFEWVSENCFQFDFVLIADDDMSINLKNILKRISTFPKNISLYMGMATYNGRPIRNFRSKYFLSFREYDKLVFPPYVTGPAMILSMKALIELGKYIPQIKGNPLQDVYIGELAEKANVEITENSHFYVGVPDNDDAMEVWNVNNKFE